MDKQTIDFIPDEGVENILDVNNDDGTIYSKIFHSGTTEVPSVTGSTAEDDSCKEDKASVVTSVTVKNSIPINVEIDITKKKDHPLLPLPRTPKKTIVAPSKPTDALTGSDRKEIKPEEEEEERDFDKNPTVLYALVQKKIWKEAVERAKAYPSEASIWVSRREKDGKLRWRLLPIHAAIVFKASQDVVESLLTAYPKGAQTKDDQGMLPLHLAFRNGASEAVVNLLLTAFPQSIDVPDRKGRVPLTLAQAAAEPHREVFVKALEKGSAYYAVAAIAAARAHISAEQEQIYEKKLSQVRTVYECELNEVRDEEDKKRKELQDKITELENDLSKTMETSQVLVDHVNSLEAQLASRSDTERFLATKIANLDEKLRQSESMKAETEKCLTTEKSQLTEERDTLAIKVDELQKKYDETSEKLQRALTNITDKETKYSSTEKELREKLNQSEVECANSKANAAILEAQLKKRMENEHLLAAQVSNLASRLAEQAEESELDAKKYDDIVSRLNVERGNLTETVEDLTKRLKQAAKAMESIHNQQHKIVDGAIYHEQIVSKALEAHAQLVTDAARQEQELEIAKEERAIILTLLSKQEDAYKTAYAKRKEASAIIGAQGQNLIETKEARETILSSVQQMTNIMNEALRNISGGVEIEIENIMTENEIDTEEENDDDDSVSPFELEAQELDKEVVSDEPVAAESVNAESAMTTMETTEEMAMISETNFEDPVVVSEDPEMNIRGAPKKKLEDIMKEITAASTKVIVLEPDINMPEARSEESDRSEGDRIMESREL